MLEVKEKVKYIVKKHETRCPFKIAAAKGIIIRYVALGGILGYYSKSHRFRVIHINEAVKAKEQEFICAHELGHAVLHPEANTPFLKRHTFYSTDRIEQEANYFAAELLFIDKTVTSSEIMHEYGVPYEVIKNF
ncbi:ImmA/IrrE family metallo-endopeptidase [Shouchella rhizosphaerae]|uniref:ImmA/IrrE family metallo-endopeptidase n=1 Tax=Shouchella rhizosphaerae TaxID=866786 RepID=UPI003F7F26D8